MRPILLDMSRWQLTTALDWTKMKANAPAGVILRSGIGSIYPDPFMEYAMTELKKINLQLAAEDKNKIYLTYYHVIRPDYSAVDQMAAFMKILKNADAEDFDLPLVLDCELKYDSVSWDQLADIIYTSAHILQDNYGKVPMLYSSLGFWQFNRQWSNDFWWWIAYYPTFTNDPVNGWKTYTKIPQLPKYVTEDRLLGHQVSRVALASDYGITASKGVDVSFWTYGEQAGLDAFVKTYAGNIDSEPVITKTLEERVSVLEKAAVAHDWDI